MRLLKNLSLPAEGRSVQLNPSLSTVGVKVSEGRPPMDASALLTGRPSHAPTIEVPVPLSIVQRPRYAYAAAAAAGVGTVRPCVFC